MRGLPHGPVPWPYGAGIIAPSSLAMTSMRIDLYTISWNERRMLPFFLDYYGDCRPHRRVRRRN
jgi:hypothetical protein